MPAVGRAARTGGGPSTGRRVARLLGVGMVAMLAVVLAFTYLHREEVEAMLAEALLGPPPRPPAVASVPRPPRPAQPAGDQGGAVSQAPGEPGGAADAASGGAADAPGGGIEASGASGGAGTPAATATPAAGSASSPAPPSPAARPAPGEAHLSDLMAEARAARATARGGDGAVPRATLDETLAAQGRRGVVDSVRPPVDVRRGEALLAGAPGTVGVSVARQDPDDLLGAGYRALLRGDIHQALATYDGVLAGQPRSIPGHLGRAAALHKLGRIEEARAAYERVLGLDPGNREALTNLLAIVAMAAPGQALAQLQALERSAPDFSPVAAQIGLVHARLGQAPEAITALRRAVALEPGNLLYRYNLAVLEDRAGLGREAAQSYQAVLDGLAAAGAGEQGAAGLILQADDIRARMRYLMSGAR